MTTNLEEGEGRTHVFFFFFEEKKIPTFEKAALASHKSREGSD